MTDSDQLYGPTRLSGAWKLGTGLALIACSVAEMLAAASVPHGLLLVGLAVSSGIGIGLGLTWLSFAAIRPRGGRTA